MMTYSLSRSGKHYKPSCSKWLTVYMPLSWIVLTSDVSMRESAQRNQERVGYIGPDQKGDNMELWLIALLQAIFAGLLELSKLIGR
jgi:hypothetical protein